MNRLHRFHGFHPKGLPPGSMSSAPRNAACSSSSSLTFASSISAGSTCKSDSARPFAFCTGHLGLTGSASFRRITAARMIERFPVLADCIADGRLNLTTLVELRDVLSEERLAEILDRSAGRTEEEVKLLVASYRPRPAPDDLLRRLPGRPASAASLETPLAHPGTAGPAVSESIRTA